MSSTASRRPPPPWGWLTTAFLSSLPLYASWNQLPHKLPALKYLSQDLLWGERKEPLRLRELSYLPVTPQLESLAKPQPTPSESEVPLRGIWPGCWGIEWNHADDYKASFDLYGSPVRPMSRLVLCPHNRKLGLSPAQSKQLTSHKWQDDSLLPQICSPFFSAFLWAQEINVSGVHHPGPWPSGFLSWLASRSQGQEERGGCY